MLFGYDLNHLFFFPFENSEARKNFLIGALLILASFIIPIIPYLFVIGYAMRIMRQIIDGEKPHMLPWEDWEGLLKDGLKLFGVRLIYTLPLLLVMCPVYILMMAGPILAETVPDGEIFFLLYFVGLFSLFICIMPFSFLAGFILPAPEAHVAATRQFSAGFRIGEWWPIFRKNLGGFLVAFLIFYGLSMVMSFAFQIIFITIILLCLLPIFIPALSMYFALLHYAIFAQAYRAGREKLTAAPAVTTNA